MGAWVAVFGSRSVLDAQLVRTLLEGAGIGTRLLGDDRIPGAFGVDAEVEVWVEHSAVPAARGVLEAAGRIGPSGALSIAGSVGGELAVVSPRGEVAIVRCPACGADWEPGFEQCWQCDHLLAADR